ncbi:MAG: hypothetical protein FJ198_05590, partial [Gammaproteobacteria bacterium]|nr:hypothetical protein [Gammaproteobacteria bacterium]
MNQRKPARKSVRKTAAKSARKSAPRAATPGKSRKPPAAKPAQAKHRRPAAVPPALPVVQAALADMKAVDVRVLDVRGVSDVADFMVIASGTSDRHLRSIADRVVQMAKAAGQRP